MNTIVAASIVVMMSVSAWGEAVEKRVAQGAGDGVQIKVETATRFKDSERADGKRKKELRKEGYDDETRREYRGEVRVRIEGAPAQREYEVRVEAVLYLKQRVTGDDVKRSTEAVVVRGATRVSVTNKAATEVKCETEPYYERTLTRERLLSKKTVKIKQKVEAWEIRVWINGELVHEEKMGGN